MKTNILCLLLCLLVAFSSCDEIVTYNENYDNGTTSYGPPEIERICSINEPDLSIDWGEMDDIILIYGRNLSNVKAIYFYDRPADLTEVNALVDKIGVRIPVAFPEEENKLITVVTEKGEAQFPFEVFIPQLLFEGLDNEFASAGDEVTLTGKYFDLYQLTQEKAVITLNGTSVKVVSATDTKLILEVPESIPDLSNTEFSISSEIIKTPVKFPFHTTGAFRLLDFKTRDDLKQKEAIVCDGTEVGKPKPLIPGEKYFWFEKSMGAWTWNDMTWNFLEPMDVSLHSDIIDNLSDYYLKFELLTQKDIKGAQFRVAIGNTNNWSDKQFRWQVADGAVPFSTSGKWKTITIDMANFQELPQLLSGTFVDNGKTVGANFMVTNFCDSTVPEDVAFAYTNFRFVKK